jgi:hypothetical protein
MKIKHLFEGLNAQQRSVPQLPAQAQARHISVLGAKTDPKHPFAGYMVGADESVEPGRKRIGPDKNDPWEKGWRAGFRQNEFNPYPAGSKEARQWDDGYAEARAQPRHYDEGRAGVDDTDTVGFYLDTERAYQAVMGRYGDMIDHDETSGIMYVPSRLWPKIEMIAFDADGIGALRHDDDMTEATGDKPFDSMMQNISKGAKKQASTDKKDQKKQSQQQARDAFGSMFGGNPTGNLKIREQGVAEEQLDEKCWDGYEKKGMKTMFGKRVPNCVKNEGAERNELDTPAVQAALAKMAERHRGEKWSKEQLAALGKRIAARGQNKKGMKETNFAQAGEILGGLLGGAGGMTLAKGKKSGYVAGSAAGSAVGNAAGRYIDKKLEPKIGKDEVGANKAVARYQKSAVAKGDMDEGWKQTVAGATLAGAAALGGGGASAADVNDPSWSKAGYDSHIKADSSLTKTTSSDGVSATKVSKDHQRRISDVVGPNAQGEYRVTVSQNGKIASQYVTKTPPPGWLVKESAVTKEDIITKLKAQLGDYLSDIGKEIKKDPDLIDKLAAKAPGDQMGPPVKTVTTDDGHEIQIHGNEDDGFRISIKNKPAATRFKNLDEAVMACEMYCAQRRKQAESADYIDEAGKDACYNKVKSRYKIWPSAYASGALVRCRKVGAANWGNKSKK